MLLNSVFVFMILEIFPEIHWDEKLKEHLYKGDLC